MLRSFLLIACTTGASLLGAVEPAVETERLASARAADVGWQTTVGNLRGDLESGNLAAQLRAVREAVRLQDPAVTGMLLPYLEPGNDPRLIAAVCVAMGNLGNVAASTGILQHLKHADADVRQSAYVAMTHLGGFTAKQHLEHLHDPDPVLRKEALFQLALHPEPEALPALAESAERHADPTIRRVCALGLGKSGDVKQASVLRHVLLDRDPRVRAAAASALAQLRDQSSIPNLLLAIDNGAVDQEIINALSALAGQDFGLGAATDGKTRRAGVERGWNWWGANADKLPR